MSNNQITELRSAKRNARLVLFALLACGLGLASGCDALFPTEAPLDNQEPLTDLANVPLALDTLFALKTMHWDGGDEDGFVTGYEWRYTTYHPGGAESVVCQLPNQAASDTTLAGWQQVRQTDWEPTKATSLTIPFDSEADLNLQVFEVRSIDNQEAPDSEPAKKCFYTEKTVVPEITLVAPREGQTDFARPQTTDWWKGVTVEFFALDPDTSQGGGVVEMGWAVDDGEWHWTEDFERGDSDTARYEVRVPPSAFATLDGTHTVRVNARDNTNLIGEPATATIELIDYTPEHDILIVDETHVGADFKPVCSKEADSFQCGGFTEDSVDEFYGDIFGVAPQHVWDYVEEGGPPPKELLEQYRMVIWHADNPYAVSSDYHKLVDHTDLLKDYMNVGGDLIMSGWRILASFKPGYSWGSNQPTGFGPGTFVHDYLHIASVAESPKSVFSPGDFGGAVGVGSDFSDVRVDSSKTAWPHEGGLGQVNVITEPAPFTEPIFAYESRELLESNDLIVRFKRASVGHRYFGSKTGFDAVVFGFPLVFLEKEDACTLGREVLRSLGYPTNDICTGG